MLTFYFSLLIFFFFTIMLLLSLHFCSLNMGHPDLEQLKIQIQTKTHDPVWKPCLVRCLWIYASYLSVGIILDYLSMKGIIFVLVRLAFSAFLLSLSWLVYQLCKNGASHSGGQQTGAGNRAFLRRMYGYLVPNC